MLILAVFGSACGTGRPEPAQEAPRGLELRNRIPGLVYAVSRWRGSVVSGGGGVILHAPGSPGAAKLKTLKLETPGVPRDLVPLDGDLLVAERSFGDVPSHLRRITLVDGRLVEVASVRLPGEALRLAVAGGRVWVACHRAGLRAVALEGRELRTLPQQDVAGRISAVAAADGLLYAADQEVGIRVFTVLDEGLREVARSGEPGRPHDLAFGGGRLALADDARGVRIFHPDGPSRLHPVTTFPTRGTDWGVDLRGSLLAVGRGHAGVGLFDLAAPGGARPVGEHEVEGFVWDVELGPDHLLAAAGDSGLWVFDLPPDGETSAAR